VITNHDGDRWCPEGSGLTKVVYTYTYMRPLYYVHMHVFVHMRVHQHGSLDCQVAGPWFFFRSSREGPDIHDWVCNSVSCMVQSTCVHATILSFCRNIAGLGQVGRQGMVPCKSARNLLDEQKHRR
jgi:hypothetical protein